MTVRSWAGSQRTEEDLRIEQWSLKRQLTATVHQIWQDKMAAATESSEAEWFELYNETLRPLDGESDTDRWLRVKAWETSNKATGKNAEALKWFKQYEQLRNCQAQWIGYFAACCGASTRPVAVPIGCNHRLCPLCASHRAAKAKKRIKTLFDRLSLPVLITLTIPNQSTISKHDFTLFPAAGPFFFRSVQMGGRDRDRARTRLD